MTFSDYSFPGSQYLDNRGGRVKQQKITGSYQSVYDMQPASVSKKDKKNKSNSYSSSY